MLTIEVDGDEILNISTIKVWYTRSIITGFYTTLILILTLVFYRVLVIIISSIFLVGYLIMGMFYFFSKASMLVVITQDKIEISGFMASPSKRKFQLEDYTHIAIREYIGRPLRTKWNCDLHVGRKYITVFRGEKQTAEIIGNALSAKLSIKLDLIPTTKTTKKQVYHITSVVFSFLFVILPLSLIKIIDFKIIFGLTLVWGLLAFLALSVTAYYANK